MNEAIFEATDALTGLVCSYIDEDKDLPSATNIKDVTLDEDLKKYYDDYIVTLIQVDPEPYLNNKTLVKMK